MIKKLMSGLLAICMLLTIMPTGVMATDTVAKASYIGDKAFKRTNSSGAISDEANTSMTVYERAGNNRHYIVFNDIEKAGNMSNIDFVVAWAKIGGAQIKDLPYVVLNKEITTTTEMSAILGTDGSSFNTSADDVVKSGTIPSSSVTRENDPRRAETDNTTEDKWLLRYDMGELTINAGQSIVFLLHSADDSQIASLQHTARTKPQLQYVPKMTDADFEQYVLNDLKSNVDNGFMNTLSKYKKMLGISGAETWTKVTSCSDILGAGFKKININEADDLSFVKNNLDKAIEAGILAAVIDASGTSAEDLKSVLTKYNDKFAIEATDLALIDTSNFGAFKDELSGIAKYSDVKNAFLNGLEKGIAQAVTADIDADTLQTLLLKYSIKFEIEDKSFINDDTKAELSNALKNRNYTTYDEIGTEINTALSAAILKIVKAATEDTLIPILNKYHNHSQINITELDGEKYKNVLWEVFQESPIQTLGDIKSNVEDAVYSLILNEIKNADASELKNVLSQYTEHNLTATDLELLTEYTQDAIKTALNSVEKIENVKPVFDANIDAAILDAIKGAADKEELKEILKTYAGRLGISTIIDEMNGFESGVFAILPNVEINTVEGVKPAFENAVEICVMQYVTADVDAAELKKRLEKYCNKWGFTEVDLINEDTIDELSALLKNKSHVYDSYMSVREPFNDTIKIGIVEVVKNAEDENKLISKLTQYQSFIGISENDIETYKNVIWDVFSANPISDIEDIKANFEKAPTALIFKEIKEATEDTIADVLEKHKTALGITSDDIGFVDSNTCDEVKAALAEVDDISKVKEELEKAIEKGILTAISSAQTDNALKEMLTSKYCGKLGIEYNAVDENTISEINIAFRASTFVKYEDVVSVFDSAVEKGIVAAINIETGESDLTAEKLSEILKKYSSRLGIDIEKINASTESVLLNAFKEKVFVGYADITSAFNSAVGEVVVDNVEIASMAVGSKSVTYTDLSGSSTINRNAYPDQYYIFNDIQHVKSMSKLKFQVGTDSGAGQTKNLQWIVLDEEISSDKELMVEQVKALKFENTIPGDKNKNYKTYIGDDVEITNTGYYEYDCSAVVEKLDAGKTIVFKLSGGDNTRLAGPAATAYVKPQLTYMYIPSEFTQEVLKELNTAISNGVDDFASVIKKYGKTLGIDKTKVDDIKNEIFNEFEGDTIDSIDEIKPVYDSIMSSWRLKFVAKDYRGSEEVLAYEGGKYRGVPLYGDIYFDFVGDGTESAPSEISGFSVSLNDGTPVGTAKLVQNIDDKSLYELIVDEWETSLRLPETEYVVNFPTNFETLIAHRYKGDKPLRFVTDLRKITLVSESYVNGGSLEAATDGETDVMFIVVQKSANGVTKAVKTATTVKTGDKILKSGIILFSSAASDDKYDIYAVEAGEGIFTGAVESNNIVPEKATGTEITKRSVVVSGLKPGKYLAVIMPGSCSSATSLNVNQIKESAYMLQEVEADADGVATFTFVSDIQTKESMVLFVKGEFDANVYKAGFDYTVPDTENDMFEDLVVDPVAPNSYQSILESYVSYAGNGIMNSNDYAQLSGNGKTNVANELRSSAVADDIETKVDLVNAYNIAVLTQIINEKTTVNDLRALLDDVIDGSASRTTPNEVNNPIGAENQAIYGIDKSPFKTKLLDKIYDDNYVSRDALFTEFLKFDVKNSNDVKDVFEVSAVKGFVLNENVSYTASIDVLEALQSNLKDTVGNTLSFTEYDKRGTNKNAVLSKFVTNMANADKLTDVKEIFDQAVSDTPIPTGEQGRDDSLGGGSGGSSSGGGGGGPSFNGISPEIGKLDVPVTDDGEAVSRRFTDISEDYWAYKFIEQLSKNQMINGYEDGSFKPENKITRAEFISIIIRAFGLSDDEAKCNFMDVSIEDWYYPYIAAAFTKGIVNGVTEDFFVPNNNITREDASVIIANTLKYLNISLGKTDMNYTDVMSISEYAMEAINQLSACNVINGYEDGSFGAKLNLTRAEACKIISRSIDVRWNGEEK